MGTSPTTVPLRRVGLAREAGALTRSLRLSQGMTQAQLAERANVSRKWLSQLEHGKPSAEFNLVCRVLYVLGVEFHAVHVTPPDGSSTEG